MSLSLITKGLLNRKGDITITNNFVIPLKIKINILNTLKISSKILDNFTLKIKILES